MRTGVTASALHLARAESKSWSLAKLMGAGVGASG